MAVVLLPSPLGERVGYFITVQCRGYISHALTFRPTDSLSTLRRRRSRIRRKTRYLTAGEALSGPPLQTAGHSALARRTPTPPDIRVTNTAGRSLQHAIACQGVGGSLPTAASRPVGHPVVQATRSEPVRPFRPSARGAHLLCRLLTPLLGSVRLTLHSARFRGTPLLWAQQRPPVVSGHTVGAKRRRMYQAPPVCRWRTSRSRARSSRRYHTSYPVRVPRPAPSFHAVFRRPLARTPLPLAA